MRVYFFSLLSLFLTLPAFSQSVDQIKADRGSYLWGEGVSTTLDRADQLALEMLISQISVKVESEFEVVKSEDQEAGNKDFKEKVRQLVKTYSTATLHNTERLIISNEPNAKVFRYIRRDQVALIFEQRRRKIVDFTATADRALGDYRVADALKYYYWALTLLRSHPKGDTLTYRSQANGRTLLISYLPGQINATFAGLRFAVSDIKDEPDLRTVVVYITYRNQPVQNLEYSYFDGRNWSPPVGAKDGMGYLEFFGNTANQVNHAQLRAEYIFNGEVRIDRELEEAIQQLEPVSFKNAWYDLRFDKPGLTGQLTGQVSLIDNVPESPVTLSPSDNILLNRVEQTGIYQEKVNRIVRAIDTRQYDGIRDLFTTEGYDVFNRLIGYGKARVLSNDSLRAVELKGTVICRGPRMSFSFSNNNRKFVEDVVFHFDRNGKVENLSFGLNYRTIEGIIGHKSWSEAERLTLVNFLEHYKTAYALKRIDYISSIFADDALIITGHVVKVKTSIENPFAGNTIIKYNHYDKTRYLNALKHTFASNEFINVAFEESNIRKGGKEGDLYGIQLKQNYYSANYGDQGYLFLLVDFNNPDEPLIQVRTWQPQKDSSGSIYGIEDF